MSSEIQAVVFLKRGSDGKKTKWNVTKARGWLTKHKLAPIKPPDTTMFKNQIRFRLKDPSKYKKFTTKKLEDINLIIGIL